MRRGWQEASLSLGSSVNTRQQTVESSGRETERMIDGKLSVSLVISTPRVGLAVTSPEFVMVCLCLEKQ